MTAQELNAIDDRAQAATPGPWIAEHRHSTCGVHDNETDGLGLEIAGPPEPMLRGQFARSADAVFIAHAREDIPRLLQEIKALLQKLERAQQATTILRRYVE